MLNLKPPRHTSTLRIPAGWSRRIADVAETGLGRLDWAESGPKARALVRTEVRAKAAIRLPAPRKTLQRPNRAA